MRVLVDSKRSYYRAWIITVFIVVFCVVIVLVVIHDRKKKEEIRDSQYMDYILSLDNETHSDRINASYDLRVKDVRVDTSGGYTICTGTVTNRGSVTYTFIRVKGAFKNGWGSVIDTDWTYAVGDEGLAPGESSTFRMSVKKNSDIKDCDVTVLE